MGGGLAIDEQPGRATEVGAALDPPQPGWIVRPAENPRYGQLEGPAAEQEIGAPLGVAEPLGPAALSRGEPFAHGRQLCLAPREPPRHEPVDGHAWPASLRLLKLARKVPDESGGSLVNQASTQRPGAGAVSRRCTSPPTAWAAPAAGACPPAP